MVLDGVEVMAFGVEERYIISITEYTDHQTLFWNIQHSLMDVLTVTVLKSSEGIIISIQKFWDLVSYPICEELQNVCISVVQNVWYYFSRTVRFDLGGDVEQLSINFWTS